MFNSAKGLKIQEVAYGVAGRVLGIGGFISFGYGMAAGKHEYVESGLYAFGIGLFCSERSKNCKNLQKIDGLAARVQELEIESAMKQN